VVLPEEASILTENVVAGAVLAEISILNGANANRWATAAMKSSLSLRLLL